MNFPPKPTKTPAYTPKQRKQIAECFRAAKTILWPGTSYDGYLGHERFICRAIRAGGNTGKPMGSWELACDVIDDRLSPCITVEHWLLVFEELTFPTDAEKTRYTQEFRHAWLDSLIAEFEGTEE